MTAYEAARNEADELGRQIRELQDRQKAAMMRAIQCLHSTILESERIATAAEPYQVTKLPEEHILSELNEPRTRYVVKMKDEEAYLCRAGDNFRQWVPTANDGQVKKYKSATEANLDAIACGIEKYEVVAVRG